MAPRIKVVQSIENNTESLEPCDIELWVFDIIMMRFDLDVGVEPGSGLFGDLEVLALLTVASRPISPMPWTS